MYGLSKKREPRRGISWFGRGRGEEEDAARQLDPLNFVLFYLDAIGVGNYLTHCPVNNALLCVLTACPEQVAEAGAEALAVETPLEPTTHLRWALLLLIFRQSQESRAHSTPYVFILHPVHSS